MATNALAAGSIPESLGTIRTEVPEMTEDTGLAVGPRYRAWLGHWRPEYDVMVSRNIEELMMQVSESLLVFDVTEWTQGLT